MRQPNTISLTGNLNVILAVVMLMIAYLFQRYNYALLLDVHHPDITFIVNKLFRFLLNEMACLLLIRQWFDRPLYFRIGVFLFLMELFIFLPIYFFIKLKIEGPTELSSPLLSQFHRLLVNPVLMILLMVTFYYHDTFIIRDHHGQ